MYQLGLFDQPSTSVCDVSSLSDRQLGELCVIPNGGFTGDVKAKARQWMSAIREASKRQARAESREFAAKGSAQKWFASWTPRTKAAESLSAALEEAIDIVAALYPSIAKESLGGENMGLLMVHRCGNTATMTDGGNASLHEHYGLVISPGRRFGGLGFPLRPQRCRSWRIPHAFRVSRSCRFYRPAVVRDRLVRRGFFRQCRMSLSARAGHPDRTRPAWSADVRGHPDDVACEASSQRQLSPFIECATQNVR